ncbi:A disintegrin and metalloproteinase with thrombospondin motifs gon-1-like isoform X2 [Styela clava]
MQNTLPIVLYLSLSFISNLPFSSSSDTDGDLAEGTWGPWQKPSDCNPVHRTETDTAKITRRFCNSTDINDGKELFCDGVFKLAVKCEENLSGVVRGFLAAEKSWPWQVFIELDDGADQCGGSLISDTWILTAAHCFNRGRKKATRIAYSSRNKTAPEPFAVNTKPEKVICHEDFNSRDLSNDICLIKIPWQENMGYAKPIPYAMETNASLSNGTECGVAGWGYDEHGNLPELLRQAGVKIIDRKQCVEWYKKSGTKIPANTICAGHIGGGADTCGGDSGGPFVCMSDNSTRFLYGITSFGPVQCGSKQSPGIYTKVGNFLPWIKKTIDDADQGYHWSPWTERCSVTCGEGNLMLYRSCLNKNNDTVSPDKCIGPDFDIDICALPICIDYSWTPWKGECDVNCGIGFMNVTRHCLDEDNKTVDPKLCGEEPAKARATCYNTKRCSDNVLCNTSSSDLFQKKFVAICPPGCPLPSIGKPAVWGTDIYTEDSYLCAAAIHSGVIEAKKGGEFTVWKIDGQRRHRGSTRHGITSINYGSWEASIVFDDPDAIYTWGPWASSLCSVTCGLGFITKRRICYTGNKSASNWKCEGDAEMMEECEEPVCEEMQMPFWGPWIESDCSVTCGTGEISRVRHCMSHIMNAPPCSTSNSQDTIPCEKPACKEMQMPFWGPWIESDCSVTCGTGEISRVRHCMSHIMNAPPCSTSISQDTIPCEKPACKEYKWGEWKGDCAITCGNGLVLQRRICLDKNVTVHIKNCEGSSTRIQPCNQSPCKEYEWGEWKGNCAVTCGKGLALQRRWCLDKNVTVDIKNCEGSSFRLHNCSQPLCKEYKWGEWQGNCAVTCGNGLVSQRRMCLNKNVTVDSKNCEGNSTRTQTCTLPPCRTISYRWGSWRDQCSVTCGIGIRRSERDCLDDNDRIVDKTLCGQEPATRRGICRLQSCVRISPEYSWGEWEVISECTASCDGGTEIKSRNCQNREKRFVSDANCGSGDSFRLEECNKMKCIDSGQVATREQANEETFSWGNWQPWSLCRLSLSSLDRCKGFQSRLRYCNSRGRDVAPHFCNLDSQNYRERACPLPGC